MAASRRHRRRGAETATACAGLRRLAQGYAGLCGPAQDGVGIPAGAGIEVVVVAEAEAAAVADAAVAEAGEVGVYRGYPIRTLRGGYVAGRAGTLYGCGGV